jgi:hypothetical protein
MPANGRAFLLLTAGLTVTRARRKRNGVLAGNKDSTSRPGFPAMPNPKASGRAHVPGEATAATGAGPAAPAGITGLVLTGAPGNADGGISRVYVFAVREIRRAIQYCPVRLSYNQCGPVRSSTV